MTKTPEQLAEEYVKAEFKGNGGNVSRAVCKYDFMSGYKTAIDLIHSNTTQDMSDLANAFAANYFGKEYAVSFDSFLAGYQAAKDETNLPTSAKWISVKERLPEEGEEIFWCHAPTCEMVVGQLVGPTPYFTHWMPLPEPPKGEG